MSASEKLKRLVERPNRYGGISSDRPTSWDVMDALPQIVAVIEAAERVSDEEENELVLSGWQVFKDVSAALDELEKALS